MQSLRRDDSDRWPGQELVSHHSLNLLTKGVVLILLGGNLVTGLHLQNRQVEVCCSGIFMSLKVNK